MKIQRTNPPTAAPLTGKDLIQGIRGLLDNRYHEKIVSELKDYFGVKHLFLLSSGKAALTLILLSLHSLSNKKNVVIPAYTCFSVPSSIVKAKLEIVPCDLVSRSFDFNFDMLEEIIDEDTLCIISTHLFGIPSDVARIKSLCDDRGIFLIEDAAQAMGISDNGRKLGTLGDVGFFSLGRGKNISCGSGGIIVTENDDIASSIGRIYSVIAGESLFRTLMHIISVFAMTLFIDPRLYWFPSGLPFLKLGETRFYPDFPIYRMNGFSAGLLWNVKEKLTLYNEIRRKNGEYYIRKLSEYLELQGHSGETSYLRFPVFVDDDNLRRKMMRQSKDRGAGITPMYPSSVNKIPDLRESLGSQELSVAEDIARTLLTIPTHSLLKDEDREKICELIRDIEKA